MLTQVALLSLMVLPSPATAREPFRASRLSAAYRPRIEVWTNRGDAAVYTRGDGVRVYFRVDQDAFVTLFRVDTDGRVRVIFPREPWEDNYTRGGREFEVEGRSARDAFYVDDYPGVGYIFAVAAADPFVYDPIASGDHWDYREIAGGRVRGDPYVALTDLAQRIVPEGYNDWDYDIVSYSVERHYDYPRFLCYDCHAYASWPYWDPYAYSCVRFRIVIFDDPWYYPYRYYGGTRVVFVRPFRPAPRFIFKEWGGAGRDQFVTRERARPVNDNTRRGVRGRDLGGVGAIPAPRETGRRERPGDDRPGHEPEGRRERARPDRPDQPQRGDRPADRPGVDRRDQPGPRTVEPVRPAQPRWDPRPQRAEPRAEPRSDPPRATPRNEPRSEPRSQPRAEPRNQPRSEPRNQPRAEPRKESPPARSQPELRRRKPS